MRLVGLGGGIGSGKSTVSALLRALGAVIVDADVIAREVVLPGGPAYEPLIAQFGREILHPDGTLNRAALAAVAFNDKAALANLNAVTHPPINAEIRCQIDRHQHTDRVVILDAALLFDRAREGMVAKMVVDVDPEVAVGRLVRYRGFSEEDARARIRNQMSREERLEKADFVIDNTGDQQHLAAEVARAWEWIQTLPETPATG